MKTKILAVLGVLLFSGLAYAVAASAVAAEAVEREVAGKPRAFPKGVYVGTEASRVTADRANKLSHTGAARIDYVFPALGSDGGTVSCYTCPYTATVEGATIGDPCVVSGGYGLTQVLDTNAEAWVASRFTCGVTSANTVTLWRCGPQSAPALADAGYIVRTFGNAL